MTPEQRAHFAKFNESKTPLNVGQMIKMLKELPEDMKLVEPYLLRVALVNGRGPFLNIEADVD